MPITVFATVIAAALLHASWNAALKSASDHFSAAIMIASAAAGLSIVGLLFLAGPASVSWPYAIASALLQIAYFLLLARTYQIAEMSLAYPLMRGAAPLIVAFVSIFRADDVLSRTAWIGIIGICLGNMGIALGSRQEDRKGLYLALLNALVIAGYTLVDGIGVRLSGAPTAYTLWVFLLTGLPLTLWALLARRSTYVRCLRRHWWLGIVGGIGTTGSYGLALWAMTRAPVASVAALRETSIVFGTVIAGLVLKEHIGPRRAISVCIIACGATLLRLA
jgi:drug/metabolite transporter (DMT)-like permease